MKKYVLKRILRSIVSLFLVTTLIFTIIYTMVPRKLIFSKDPLYTKMSVTPDSKADYTNTVYEKMGYINYLNSKELQEAAKEVDASVTVDPTAENKSIYEEYIDSVGSGWELHQFEESKLFYATREIPIYQRIFEFYANMFEIDHTNKIQDPENPDLERYIRLENDPAIGWSVVGSGTKHKYLLYVNSQFPFVHQNFVKFNLGISYPTYANIDVLEVLTNGQGKALSTDVKFPTGQVKKSAIDIYSRTYKSPSVADAKDKANFGDDPYSATKSRFQDPSMIANSSIIGLIGIAIMYAIALPLGMLMAQFKNKMFDTVSTSFLSFLLALPSVAFVYIFRLLLGNLFSLPSTFPELGAGNFKSYLLPAILLGLLSAPSLAIWVRRYIIDLQSSDFVRFARAKGLTEAEIAKRHVFKNAMVPIVVGIPSAIVSVIAGATFTESVFAFPGMGKMLIDSINVANNSMVVALTFIFSALSIFALLLGDILMTIIDPRIKLDNSGGGK